jgi:predicted AlkP superfamily pyrophosphatase or phosphodiesterase
MIRTAAIYLPGLLALGALAPSCRQVSAPAVSSPIAPEPRDGVTGSEPTEPPTSRWADSDRMVLLVSLDGVRWDYMDRVDTPALDRIASEGVRADGLVPVFPSKTFPNHFTQVTGLYPAEHGIVGNSFWDNDLDDSFDMSETGSEWWGGEPIWITAAKQGLRTTTMYWPGSETDYDGVRPDEWIPFDPPIRNDKRVDQVLEWIDEPQPPHFATLYFSDVDGAGHSYGPESPEVDTAMRTVDGMVQRLLDGLEERDKLDDVDLIVVSDHGMAQLSRDRAIFLDDHVDIDAFWIAAWGPYATLDPKDGDTTGVLEALADLPHATCTDDATRPAELHFPSGARIPPILCVAEVGWGITSRPWFDDNPSDLTGATHGFLSSARDMHGLFLARGPHLQQGLQTPPLSSVHLYELMAELLQITPAPNSGDPDATRGMLRP